MRRRCRNRYQCRINLKMLRKSFGITQQEIADRLYYSVRTVERFEKENATTNEETAKVLAEILQIPLHRITDSASNGSVFPVVTEHFSASSDHAFL